MKEKKANLFSEISYGLLKESEPALSMEEKDQLWKNIDRRTRQGIHRPVWYYVAASIAILAIGSWMLLSQNPFARNPYTRLSEMVSIDTLKSTRLYIDDQQVELGETVEIRCLPATNQIEVISQDASSFKLSVPSGKETYMQLAVPAGKRAQVILADKSKITIRSKSKFIFPFQFKKDSREVKLEGEAYMQITHNKYQRFIAKTNKMEICVLGTEFLVVAYPHQEEESVVLVKGLVQITPDKGKPVTIYPNQKYTYNGSTFKKSLSSMEVASAIGWKENLLVVENESLGEVLRKIEEYYNVNFSYNWEEFQNIHITGKLDVSVSLDEILEHLSRIAPITVYNNQKTIKIVKATP
jgi:Fe2+-dicitrate sensor, membrane component